MSPGDKVNVLMVDDQPAKLLAYEVILRELGENLIRAASAKEALGWLLKTDVAVILIDVCMPDLDGFELASMVRNHPRFQQTAIIFVSAIHFTDLDRLRGYELGAVDYVPVPVVPELLRAKVKVFAELFRKTRQLEQLNADLERRVAARTAELEASNRSLRDSERRREVLFSRVNVRPHNIPTIVKTILHMAKAVSIHAFVKSIEGRIRALSKAQNLIAKSGWKGTQMDHNTSETLAKYCVGDTGR